MFKKIIRWMIALGIAFFLLLQAWQFFVAIPLWKLTDVQVAGNLYWTEEAILSQLELPTGTSIFAIDLHDFRDTIEQLPQVSKARPYRKLPSTIVIEIEERTPWAKIMLNGKNVILGKDGKILNVTGVNVVSSEKLFQLRGLSSIKELEPFAKKFRTSLENLRSLFPESLIEVQVLGLFEIQCKIQKKLLIVWGSEGWVKEKTKILKAILPVIKGKWNNVAYIDVRSPKNLAIRYKQR